jgi:hypothetical protein
VTPDLHLLRAMRVGMGDAGGSGANDPTLYGPTTDPNGSILPLWVRRVLSPLGAVFPAVSALDAGAQAAAVAVADLPLQRDRIVAERDAMQAAWIDANGRYNNFVPDPIYAAFVNWNSAIADATTANEAALSTVREILYAGSAVGFPVGGLLAEFSPAPQAPGLGRFGDLGISAALTIIAVGIALGIFVYVIADKWNQSKVIEAQLPGLRRASLAYADVYADAIAHGRTPPPPPSGYNPGGASSSDRAVSGLITVAGVAVVGWLALQWFSARRANA